MEPQNTKSPQSKPTKGYGKRPVWQWVVLYITIGVIVYGVIYYFITMGNNTGTPGY
jgi:hypothetical protein